EQAERMMRANLNLNDFLDMNKQIRKMGGISKLVSALPGGDKAMSQGQVDEGALDRMEDIIFSMTKKEREKPDILNGSRRVRIAAGAGVQVSDVNQVIKKFNETKKMMKQFMPAEEVGGKRGKKGKKKRRRSLPGMNGMSMADMKKMQDMMKGMDL
ncbi:MAG: signal recognition particle protein, partial [Raoultibacter sp.]